MANRVILKAAACVTALSGVAMLPPLGMALADGDAIASRAFLIPALAAFVLLAAARPWRRTKGDGAPDVPPRPADAIAAVAAAWVAVSLFGAVPLVLCGGFASVTDAVFESTSGFTTTGATILPDVEALPRAINLWRCETHWLGGMGVIALAVALVPLLGVGGFRLMNAESTGPEKGRLTARLADTAKALWTIYACMTAAQVALLRLSGMGWFDSACHAFSTLGTGGFSTRNASLAAFSNPAAEWICTVFMFAAAVNFGLWFRLFSARGRGIWRSTEVKAFAAISVVATLAAATALRHGGTNGAIRESAFQVASVISTTGFATADWNSWSASAQCVLFLLLFVGGCSGSTAGGVKVVRWALLAKQGVSTFRSAMHPSAVRSVRVDGVPVRDGLVAGVAGFLFAYTALVAATSFAGCMAGLPPWEALTAALSMAGNVGPAFGSLGPAGNYAALPAALKWWYCFAMLAGRLEVFTMLALAFRRAAPGR